MKPKQDSKPFSQRPSSKLTLHLRKLYEAIQPEVEMASEASAPPGEIAKNRFSLLELGILRSDSLGREATEYLNQCLNKEGLLLLLLIQNRLLRQEIAYFDQELANQASEAIINEWLEAEPAYYGFSEDEFRGTTLSPRELIAVITADGIQVPEAPSEIESLNCLLEGRSLHSRFPHIRLTKEAKDLVKRESTLRSQEHIKLNRLILETAHPLECPMREMGGRETLERMHPEVFEKEKERQAKSRLQQRDRTPSKPRTLTQSGCIWAKPMTVQDYVNHTGVSRKTIGEFLREIKARKLKGSGAQTEPDLYEFETNLKVLKQWLGTWTANPVRKEERAREIMIAAYHGKIASGEGVPYSIVQKLEITLRPWLKDSGVKKPAKI